MPYKNRAAMRRLLSRMIQTLCCPANADDFSDEYVLGRIPPAEFEVSPGNIPYNTIIATASADRLVENSEIFLFGGDTIRKAKNSSTSPAE